MAQALQRAMKAGVPYDLEVELITTKGNHRWVHTNGQAIRENGKIVRLAGSIQDITERKQVEAVLAEQLDELRRWQVATLGREGRVAELKHEVNALAARLGIPLPYATPEDLEQKVLR